MRYIFVILLGLSFFGSPVRAAEPVGDLMPDLDFQNFEGQFNPFLLVGTPFGPPTNASTSITSSADGVKNGNYALKFSYKLNENSSPALADFRFLLTDLVAISFWIKSEKDANWIVFLVDPDGVGFLSNTVLQAGQWQQIWLRPDHFVPVPFGETTGDAVDPSRLDVGLVMLDGNNKSAPTGSNTIYIDDFTIFRFPLQYIAEDFIVSAGQQTISEPTSIKGDLIVENGARLDVTASRFEVEGNVIVRDNGVLHFQNGNWRFLADYPSQYVINVSEGSSLTFTNGKFRLLVGLHGEIATNSLLRFDTVLNGTAGVTFKILETAALELVSSKFIGEFILSEDTRSLARDSDLVIYWLECGSEHVTPLIVPDGEFIESWTSSAGWNREMTIENSSFVLWTFLVRPNCGLRLQDSNIRAMGLVYWSDVGATDSVSGLQADFLYEDTCVETAMSSICLLNSSVEAWNVYTVGSAVVNVFDSVLGEAIAFETSQLNLTNSTMNATGGHLGSQDDAQVNFSSGAVISHIRSDGTSRLTVTDSSISGNIYSSGDAVITLQNSTHEGDIFTFGNGTVIEQ